MKILLVEDDEFVAEAIVAVLNNQNYVVEIAPDGETAWDLVEIFDYDLILLDVILPKLDGISLCRKIRLHGLQMPIMLLTGCDSSHEKATGLDAGADDYLVKPFDQEELIARVRALLRRGVIPSQPVLEWNNLRLDPTSCEVTYGEQPLSLTKKEYALLELFLRNSHRVFSCGMILEHLWSYNDAPGEEAVRTHIKGLRTKLRSVGAPGNLVETVYGIGYRLKLAKEDRGTGGQEEDTSVRGWRSSERVRGEGAGGASVQGEFVSSSSLSSPSPHPPLSPTSSSPTPKQTLLAIASVWNRFKGRVGEQVTLLEEAAVASSDNVLNQELRKQAFQEAHTLAGSLGTFGFPLGSKLARKIEHLLKTDKTLTKAETTQFQSWVELLRQEIARNQDETVSSSLPDEYPVLLVVDRDRSLASQLAIDASNFKVAIATDIQTAIQKLYQEHPSAVLLDPSVSPLESDSLRLLWELKDRKPRVSVIVFTEQSDFSHRLQVARHGGHTFLQKPLPIAQILQAVTQVLQHAPDAEAHVLAVDDDPKIGALLQVLLTPWGIKVTTLSDPQRFWETLESVKPDFLILDVEMPDVNGMEICQVVRNDPRWSELPILFLTVHNDANIIDRVFAVGADDFVSKPIVGPELVTRIINRLERIKLRQRLAQTQQAEAAASKNDITRIRQQTTVAKLAQSALSGKDFSSLMNEAVEIIAQNLEVEYCNISEFLPKENTLVLRSGVGWDAEFIGQEIINLDAVVLSPVIIEDLETSESNSFLQQHQVKSGLSVPICTQNRIYGVLGAYTRKKRTFSLDDMNFVQAIANILSAALERQQTEQALRKGKGELELRVAERTAELIRINQQLQLELNERQRTQEALRNSQSRFAGIVEIADDAIISIDSSQRITLFNQGAEKIFGYTAAEVLGQPMEVLLPLRYIKTHRQHVSEFGNSTKVARRMGERREIYGCRKDGSEFPAEASISKLKLGEETVYTVYLQDISDRKQVERMKDEFVSVTSHELRTPLTSIHGSLKMLASDLIKSDSEQGKRLLEIAVNSSERLVRLVNDILDIERIKSGKVKMEKQTCNIADLITQAVNVIQPLAEAANVTLSVSSLSLLLWVDGDRIVQTLTNLLSNAIKFSNLGATIQVSAELRNQEGGQGGQGDNQTRGQPDKGSHLRAEVTNVEQSGVTRKIILSPHPPLFPSPPLPLPPSSYLLICVKDTGRGIPPDKLESIFERFQQVDSSDSRNYDGTGLGLAICKSIVQQHGGCIWAESVLGEGSNFYLALPVVQSQDSELLFS
ncbi:two-component transcriptional regulator [Tolypothrix sp. NIES-4075]|uniref:response regulator n=1 Tax=Tolypothrix sp. NIES-4075 TaxID=2005459 RepID=UPI000B5C4662|nr:response regulator [Tolypothrix sp. NIES-4075]GAX40433.1 two-component transcriptional regulator [Tolypothrix sp. NIES-4075]